MKNFALAAAIILAPSAAFAQIVNDRMIGEWYVAEARSSTFKLPQCWTNREFADGTKLSINADPATGRVTLKFENSDWLSLPSTMSSDAEKQMKVRLTFEGTDQVYNGEFTGWSGSAKFGVKPSLYRHFQGEEVTALLEGLSNAEALVVEASGRHVGRFPMGGSTAALQASGECVQRIITEQQARAANDPFRN